MRLHLPVSLFRSLLTCFAAVAATTLGSLTAPASVSTPEDELLMLLAEQEYPNGSITYTTSQTSALTLEGYESVLFKNIRGKSFGGAIYNPDSKVFTLSNNGEVIFNGNSASSLGGAIYNNARFKLSGNGDVTFSGNSVSSCGGAIYNYLTFTLSGNGSVTFCRNSASSSYGGAIYNSGTFTLSGNGALSFSENTASSHGGAIYNSGAFTLSGNGNVRFEKNAEVYSGIYRLRSIYSTGPLNLSASEGTSILFKDSVYASGTVSLNSGGAGDVIFTGAYVEKDLRELKGEAAISAEIQRSLTSQFHSFVTIDGGSLQVQEGAKLTFDGLTVGAFSQSASLQLQNGWVDVSSPLILAPDSSLTFSGCNYLLSSGIVAGENNTLSLTIGEENRQQAVLTVVGCLQGEPVAIDLGDLSKLNGKNYHILHVIGNSDGWETADIRLTGASTKELTWVDGDLYYRYDSSQLTPQTKTDRLIEERITIAEVELLSEYQSLSFEGVCSGITNDEYIVILGNELVSFSGNTASSESAIDNRGVLTLSGNGEVSFGGNAVSSSSSAYGGAIYNSGATFTLSGNTNVAFSGNTVSSSSVGAYGGAIYNKDATFTLSGNGDVVFCGNTASSTSYADAYGGAIYNINATFTLRGNEDVSFSGNTATGTSTYAAAYGGAIYNGDGTFAVSENGAVTFSQNTALAPALSTSHENGAYGGAIYNGRGTFTVSGNGVVSFSGNMASSYSAPGARGGAIFHNGGTFTVSGNGTVTLSGNSAFASTAYVCGGAIYNGVGTFTVSGNGAVTFSGNTASSYSSSSDAYGGAIYNEGTFTLSGNGDVIFEKNAEIRNGSYRLRSIYSTGILNLSATEGKSILFKDSVYAINKVNLNQDGTGDIIFTGFSTEADLREVKGRVMVTAQEIENSRSSVLDASVTLGGGTLQVRDAASLTVRNLTAKDGSELVLYDASLSVTRTGTLAAVTTSGNSSIAVQEGASLSLTQQIVNSGVLSLSGTIIADALDVVQTGSEGPRYISTEGVVSTSGFLSESAYEGFVVLVAGSGALNADDVRVMYRDSVYTLGSDGIASVIVGNIDYSTYYINGETVSLSIILEKESTATVRMDSGVLELNNLSGSYSNKIEGSGSVLKTDSGTVTLNVASTYSGGTLLREGTLVVTNLQALGTGAVNLAGGALNLNALNGTLNNALHGVGGLSIKNGGKTLTLNGVSTYSGGTQMQGGTLVAGNASAFGTGAVTLSGGSLNLNSKLVVNTVQVTGRANITSGNNFAGSLDFVSGTLSGDTLNLTQTATVQSGTLNIGFCGVGAVQKTTAGTVTLNGASSYSGGTTLLDGTLVLKHANALGVGAVELSGGTLDVNSLNGTLNNALNGGGGLIIDNDSNTLTLGGISSYSGGTMVQRGMLAAGADSAFGTGMVTLSGGTLKLNDKAVANTVQVIGDASITGGSNFAGALDFVSGTLSGDTLNLTQTATVQSGTLNIGFCGVGAVQKTTAGTVTLNGASSYSGGTTLLDGTLVLKHANALGLGAVELAGGTLDVNSLNGTLNNAINGVGGLTINNEGKALILNGVSSYSGGTLVQGGTLVAGNASAFGTGAVTLSGGTLNLNELNGTLNNAIIGVGGLSINNGSNILTLSGVSSYSGGTLVQGGTLVAGNASAFGTGAVTLSGGTLNLNGRAVANTVQVTGSASITGGSAYAGTLMLMGGTLGGESLNLTQTATLQSGTVNTGFSGVGAVQKTTSGTVTLNGASTYSGGTLVQGGTLVAGNASAFGTGAVTLAGGTLNLNGKAVANTVQVTGSASIRGGSSYAGTLMLMGGTVGGEALNLVQTADLQSGTVNSSFSGAGAVQKTTAGTVTLNAASAYSGGTLLREGTLVVKNLQALGTGAVNLSGGTLNLNNLNGTFSNALTGTGSLTIDNGSNTLTLSGNSSFLGGITLQRGKLVAGNDAAFGRGEVTLAGGTLDMNRMAANNTLAVTGTATLNNANRYTGQLVLDGGSLSGTALQLVKDATLYSGSIANNMTGRGGVIKEGTGTATLTGLNTYSGETVINKGTLKIAGLVTSNIRLNEAGTLNTGSGMTLTFNQKLTMAGGNIVGAFSTGAGSNLVVQQGASVSGSLTFGGGCVTLNNQGLDNTLRVSGTLNLSEKTELKLVGYDTAGAYVLATYGSLWGSLSNLDVTMAFPEGSRQMAALASASGYLVLTITGDATVLNWRGGSGVWETLGSAQWGADSWVDDKRFHAYDTVVFDRGGSLSINGTVLPKEVQVSGSAAVSFSGSGSIGGESTLLKEGSCELTLNAANSYTGGSTLRGGSVKATGAQSFGTNRIWLQSGTLNLNGQAVSNAVTASGGSISGGSAYAGELTVDGRVSVSGSLTAGAVNLLSGTLTGGTLTDTTVYATAGSIESAFGGYSELVGNNYALQSAVSNTGTLRLSGIFDLSGMTPEQSHTERVDLNGNTGTSGFTVSGSYNLRLVNGGKIDNAGAVFFYNGSELSLNANGTVGYTGATDYSTYYMQKGDTLSSSAIHRMGAGAAVNMLGGSLTADDAVAVTAQGSTLRLQGGSITGGTITDCTVNAVSGSIRADISGNSTMTVSGNVRADGALQLNALTLQSGTLTADIATADVTKLTVGQGSLDGALTLNGGSVTFGSSPLSVSGQLALVSSTALDVSAYTKDGTYTLIAAGSFTGDISKQLSIANESSRYAYTLSQDGSKLNLSVAVLSEDHTWTDAKGTLNGSSFAAGDSLTITDAAAITITGTLKQGGLSVTTDKNVTLTADKKTAGSGLSGDGTVTKSGAGVLTLNAGNTYSGGTELNAGTIKATAADSFGSGAITVKGGTLDLASKAVANDIVLSGTATLKGDAKYAGNVTVAGKATLLAKTSYKGTTTIGEDSSLTLGAAATMAGNVALEGGTLTINNAKGMTLAKNQSMMLDGGEVRGLVTVGAGGTLAWQEGTMQNAPVLKGGTLDLGGKNALTLTGVKAQVQFGDKVVDLPGKGIVRSDETLDVLSGTVKLTAGAEHADIKVSGNAALVNGATHRGNITVDGTLAKGTTIKLIDSHQTVELNGAGSTAAAISGIGTVNVNASIDATAAKLAAANMNLNSGTFTNTKGIKLAKGQTLTLNGASVNLGAKGILTTAAGSTLKVSESATLSGSLTLGGGGLVFEGAALTVKGTLTLSKPVSVTGSGTLICDSVKPFKGDLGTLFGGADVKLDGTTLTINGGATKKSLVAAPVAEEEAPLDAAPALPTLPEMPATNPVADAIAQADWGILDANRAFTGAVNTRHQHAALLDKGRGAAWVSAFGTSVRHGNQGAHHGSDGNIEGAALGMEHSVSETGVLGLAVGRSKNRIGATGVTHLRQETAHVALYGQKQLRNGLTADATAAWGDTETKLGGSSWQQKSAALSGRLTHAHMLNDATAVRTFGGLSYEATESGSFGADSRSGSVQNLRAELGAGATHTAGKAHVYGEAALTGDLIRHNPSVEMGGIRHHGATPGLLGVKGTFGAFYSFTDTWTGTASYSIEAESRSTSHTLNVGVSKQF